MFYRSDNRSADQLRPIKITPEFISTAEGSVLIEVGNTRVICTASIEETVPQFLRNSGKGWISSEYAMLPRATLTRTPREVAKGRPSGRTHEIQRLIGRSLRAVTDLSRLGERTLWIDCDVIQADGGTRTASITGAFVALGLALEKLVEAGTLPSVPLLRRRLPRRRGHELRHDRQPQDGRSPGHSRTSSLRRRSVSQDDVVRQTRRSGTDQKAAGGAGQVDTQAIAE